jgi:hypothetical protein
MLKFFTEKVSEKSLKSNNEIVDSLGQTLNAALLVEIPVFNP